MTTKALSPRQQEYLEHVHRAEELGISLREYADAQGLKVKDIYNVKRQLVKKGVLGTPTAATADFVAVRIADPGGAVVCRLRHPSGWEISCGNWPPAAWLTAVLSGGQDAAG